MPVSSPKLDNVFFEDQQPARSDIRAELLAGLKLQQKQINPKYFYDARGSELFEQITQLPEYYLTRTERAILRQYATKIAGFCGSDCVLIEPGSGSSEKVRLILDTLRPVAYVPLDISTQFLYESAMKLGGEFPWLNIHAKCLDFAEQWVSHTELPAGRRVVFYPGSTIGNLDPDDARAFLSGLREWINDDGGLLVGVDLHKSEKRLNAAYNDAQGVTAEFNLNILNSINTLTGANFDCQGFSHRAFYNQELRRIEMHLVSKQSQAIDINGNSIEFEKGETLHTESSYKYSLESFTALSNAAGFTLRQNWFDEEKLFGVHYLTVTA